MLETPHVAVGAAIAVAVSNPLLAIPLALASHMVLDHTPHWNPHFYTETKKFGKPTRVSTNLIIGDIIVSLVLGFSIAFWALPNTGLAILIIACSFAAVLPDVIKTPYFFLNSKNELLRRWVNFERSIQVEVSFIPGMIVQLLIIIASLYWIFH